MWANDTVAFAVRQGLYPKDADPLKFSFSDTFAPVDFAGARLGEARAYNMLKQVSDDAEFGARYAPSFGNSLFFQPLYLGPGVLPASRVHPDTRALRCTVCSGQ